MDNKPLSREKLSGILIKSFELAMDLYETTKDPVYLQEARFTYSKLNGLIWQDFRHYDLVSKDLNYTISGWHVDDYVE